MYKTQPHHALFYIGIAVLCIIANICAFAFQFLYYELPCPLCLLQRFGFLAISLGSLLSIQYHQSLKYDAIIILSTLYTFIVGLRQVLLHIEPNDPGYGSKFMGLHFYTWSALISLALIIAMAIAPLLNKYLDKMIFLLSYSKYLSKLLKITLILLVFINVISTYFECGFGSCPANPTSYLGYYIN